MEQSNRFKNLSTVVLIIDSLLVFGMILIPIVMIIGVQFLREASLITFALAGMLAGIIQPLLVFFGILSFGIALYGLFSKNHIKKSITLFLFGVLFLSVSFYSYLSPTALNLRKEQNTRINTFKSRYDVLNERFKLPQIVVGLSGVETLILDDNTFVDIMYPYTLEGHPFIPEYESRMAFKQFLEKNVVGKQVMIKLPPEDFFLKNYCCIGKEGGESYPEVAKRDIISAFVTFEGISLNDMMINK